MSETSEAPGRVGIDIPGRVIVRNMGSNKTHLADVERTIPARLFGAAYHMPDPETRALCGVRINDGVVMQVGTRLLCGPCKHIGGDRS